MHLELVVIQLFNITPSHLLKQVNAQIFFNCVAGSAGKATYFLLAHSLSVQRKDLSYFIHADSVVDHIVCFGHKVRYKRYGFNLTRST